MPNFAGDIVGIFMVRGAMSGLHMLKSGYTLRIRQNIATLCCNRQISSYLIKFLGASIVVQIEAKSHQVTTRRKAFPSEGTRSGRKGIPE